MIKVCNFDTGIGDVHNHIAVRAEFELPTLRSWKKLLGVLKSLMQLYLLKIRFQTSADENFSFENFSKCNRKCTCTSEIRPEVHMSYN